MAKKKKKAKGFKKALAVGGKVLSVAAPIVGTVLGGPVGAALGSAVGQVAAKGTAKVEGTGKKGARKEQKRAAIVGGIVTAVSGIATAAAGEGATSGILGTIGKLFGPSAENSVLGDVGESGESSSVLGAVNAAVSPDEGAAARLSGRGTLESSGVDASAGLETKPKPAGGFNPLFLLPLLFLFKGAA